MAPLTQQYGYQTLPKCTVVVAAPKEKNPTDTKNISEHNFTQLALIMYHSLYLSILHWECQ